MNLGITRSVALAAIVIAMVACSQPDKPSAVPAPPKNASNADMQINQIIHSPMPDAVKQQKIAELKAQRGQTQ